MIEEKLFSSWKFFLIHQKYYFDAGNAIMSYPTKVMLVFGFSSVMTTLGSPALIALAGFLYGVLLYICGRIYLNYGFLTCEQEVRNRNDAFVKEMRQKIVKKNG